MTRTRRDIYTDLALSVFSLAGAALLFVGASDLPAARFEPLGSSALPYALGVLIALFAAIIGLRALFALRAAMPNAGEPSELANPGRMALVFVATLIYVAALDSFRAPYIVATTLFIIAIGATIGSPKPRSLALFAVLGLVLAVAIRFVFTRFLYVDLG
ncbi:tripartite tricarboxylate transporter TctB family protein [Consotaella salsifontis]|uniref:Putative tricarboxylic transport membrane protein n=1 Tax=Consotaella salsifontis TaxID=1365950 RepID=A0A1T4N2B1_9HYPH|nr:tripartite tricarboxylate transporter TctB family protein [Consotaella salsifontis]SJZ73423.1 putative tricarboxylic transport membrane protein [Consotaella salsifontis]